MANVWVLMHNVEVTYVHDGEDGVSTTSTPIRVYQQRATAFAKMEQANQEAGATDEDGNHQYYSIEEVAYV